MQFRTGLQHSWATAVETVDTFLREGLKSHRGSPDWQRFFALMSTSIAMREGCRRVPRTPKDDVHLVPELREYAEKLHVVTQLEAFQRTLSIAPSAKRIRLKWMVLELDPGGDESRLEMYGYTAGELEDATARLEALERHKAKGVDAVLVSVADMATLTRAYPNYFLDTTVFLDEVKRAIS